MTGTAPANRSVASPLLVALAVLVLAGAGWYLARRPASGATDPNGLPPGNDVNIRMGRGAVMVDGDAPDPLVSATFSQAGNDLPTESGEWGRRWRVLAFFDPSAGPVQARIQTKFRTFERTLDPTGPIEPFELLKIDLAWTEQLPTYGVPDTSLAFSPDGHALAIGSASGELKLLPLNGACEFPGKPVIDRKIPEGLIKDLAFTPDGSVLVAGEQSPDGCVYGLDTKDGKELWKFLLAQELGNERSPGRDAVTFYSLPSAMRILPLEGGDVLVLGMHAWKSIIAGKEQKNARCRIYRLDGKSGTVRWRYPADQPSPRNITWISASADGSRVAGVQSMPGAGQTNSSVATLDAFFLDGATGAETGRLSFDPFKPFTSTYSWQSLSMLKDGSAGVLGAGDGRVWAFDLDKQGKPALRWDATPGTPIQVGGTSYHCSIGWGAASPQAFCVTVGGSSVEFGAAPPAGFALDLHPEAMTVQAFNAAPGSKAERLWRYDVPGEPQGLWHSPNNRWLALAYQKDPGTSERGEPTPPDYGLAMLDMTRPGAGAKKLIYQHATQGPLFFRAAFSNDGRLLAVVEGPRQGADKLSATRTYRVLILH